MQRRVQQIDARQVRAQRLAPLGMLLDQPLWIGLFAALQSQQVLFQDFGQLRRECRVRQVGCIGRRAGCHVHIQRSSVRYRLS